MTATEMEDLLKNLDLRTSRIEQFLPTLASKEEVRAIRNDLDRFATKDDLKAFATKEDLKAFATKAEMKEGFAGVDTKINGVQIQLEQMRESIETLAVH